MEAYEVVRKIGQGATGSVHLVRRLADGRELALKRVDFSGLSRDDQRQTLLEVSLLSRLRHPNIVEYVEHFHDGDELCIVLEYAPDDLSKLFARAKASATRISEDTLLGLLAQLGSALHYAHGCRVLHRDVKPANVLLTASGVPKLSDFGISCTLVRHRLHLGRALSGRSAGVPTRVEDEGEAPCELQPELVGTPAYMAPELFNHTLQVDGSMYGRATDVWALGVLAFEMMFHCLPYAGASMISVVYQLVNDVTKNALAEERRRAAHAGRTLPYSAQLCACVEGMLHKRPAQRISLPEL